MPGERNDTGKGRILRLATYPFAFKSNTATKRCNGCRSMQERHRRHDEFHHDHSGWLQNKDLMPGSVLPEKGW